MPIPLGSGSVATVASPVDVGQAGCVSSFNPEHFSALRFGRVLLFYLWAVEDLNL